MFHGTEMKMLNTKIIQHTILIVCLLQFGTLVRTQIITRYDFCEEKLFTFN